MGITAGIGKQCVRYVFFYSSSIVLVSVDKKKTLGFQRKREARTLRATIRSQKFIRGDKGALQILYCYNGIHREREILQIT
jgi:hypothetical protein